MSGAIVNLVGSRYGDMSGWVSLWGQEWVGLVMGTGVGESRYGDMSGWVSLWGLEWVGLIMGT